MSEYPRDLDFFVLRLTSAPCPVEDCLPVQPILRDFKPFATDEDVRDFLYLQRPGMKAALARTKADVRDGRVYAPEELLALEDGDLFTTIGSYLGRVRATFRGIARRRRRHH